jgi:hypothetical protein
MLGTWNEPAKPLRVEPVVIVGDFAVAGWTQGDMGGRALLVRRHGKWTIAVCGGDALKAAETLVRAAVPPDVARNLADQTRAAEALLDPRYVVQLSKFEGLVTIDGSGHHPPRRH